MSQLNDLWVKFLNLTGRMTRGEGALIVQPYTEVNSKRGTQFELAFVLEGLGAGNTSEIAIATGSSPLAVKGITTQFNGESITTQLFKGGDFSGGTPIPTYALRDSLGTVCDAVFTGGITAGNLGIPVGPVTTSLGNTTQGNSVLSTVGLEIGVERILESNSTYIYQITNTSGSTQDIAGVVTWYEGELDF